jgi:hypothetical protein
MHDAAVFYGNIFLCVYMFALHLWSRRQPDAGLPWLLPFSIAYGLLAFGIWFDNTYPRYAGHWGVESGFAIIFAIQISRIVATQRQHRKQWPFIPPRMASEPARRKEMRIYNDWAKPDPE